VRALKGANGAIRLWAEIAVVSDVQGALNLGDVRATASDGQAVSGVSVRVSVSHAHRQAAHDEKGEDEGRQPPRHAQGTGESRAQVTAAHGAGASYFVDGAA